MSERIRIAILWQQLSSHTSACFNALASEGAEILLIHRAATNDAPFDDDHLRGGLRSEIWIEGTTLFLGLSSDIPVPGDYNGDSTTDPAIFRPSAGGWYINGQAPMFYGLPNDIPTPKRPD